MAEKSMKQKFADGELVLCMNLRLARSVDIAMIAKAGGYDALYVDMQHAPYSIETTATICAASLGIGITPLVRVPNHEAQWMSRVLDGGAQGVILPDVNTRAEAEAIVAACRFPPLGKRSVMGLGPSLGYRAVPLSELNPKLNAETAVIVMLETGEGVESRPSSSDPAAIRKSFWRPMSVRDWNATPFGTIPAADPLGHKPFSYLPVV